MSLKEDKQVIDAWLDRVADALFARMKERGLLTEEEILRVRLRYDPPAAEKCSVCNGTGFVKDAAHGHGPGCRCIGSPCPACSPPPGTRGTP